MNKNERIEHCDAVAQLHSTPKPTSEITQKDEVLNLAKNSALYVGILTEICRRLNIRVNVIRFPSKPDIINIDPGDPIKTGIEVTFCDDEGHDEIMKKVNKMFGVTDKGH